MRRAQVVDGGFSALDELDGPRALGASRVRALGPHEDVGHGCRTERGGMFLNVILDVAKGRQGRFLIEIWK